MKFSNLSNVLSGEEQTTSPNDGDEPTDHANAMSEAPSNCTICYESFGQGGIVQATMPCCEREGSSMKFCIRCIELICQQNPTYMRLCPRCSGPIEVSNQTVIIPQERRIICRMCCQEKLLSCFNRPSRNLCSSCEVGVSNTLHYECSRCHQVQPIPHPMYRYQETPNDFGGATWHCHRGCNDWTRWRIVPDDVLNVDEVPESWVDYLRERAIESVFEIN